MSSALAVACRDVDVRNVKAIIIGPADTPYEFGFFEVCAESIARFTYTNKHLVLSEIWQRYKQVIGEALLLNIR